MFDHAAQNLSEVLLFASPLHAGILAAVLLSWTQTSTIFSSCASRLEFPSGDTQTGD